VLIQQQRHAEAFPCRDLSSSRIFQLNRDVQAWSLVSDQQFRGSLASRHGDHSPWLPLTTRTAHAGRR